MVFYFEYIDFYFYLLYGYEPNVVSLKWRRAICGFGCISAEYNRPNMDIELTIAMCYYIGRNLLSIM